MTAVKREFTPNKIVYGSQVEPGALIDQMISENIQHFLQENRLHHLAERLQAERIEGEKEAFFADPLRYFGDGLMGWLTYPFHKQEHKPLALAAIDQAMGSHYGRNVCESVFKVADELMLNAILDAPDSAIRAGRETARYASRPPANLHLLMASDEIILMCEDFYGELNPQKVLQRIKTVMAQGARESMVMEPGHGAGLGCYMMFEECQRLFFCADSLVRTVVVAAIDAEPSAKKRATLSKNFHLVY